MKIAVVVGILLSICGICVGFKDCSDKQAVCSKVCYPYVGSSVGDRCVCDRALFYPKVNQ